jgi:hypothetical protein
MEYMICFRETAAEIGKRDDPQAAPAYWAAWMAYVNAIHASGTFVSGAGLQPPRTAAVVRVEGGKRHVQDGPYADAREQLGGFFVLNVASLDEALEWAARAPCAAVGSGSVEVRPVLPPPAQ